MSHQFSTLEISFSPQSLMVLNIAIAFIMFGVALSIKKAEFIEIKNNPKSVFAGVLSQFFLLPLATFLLILVIQPLPELALGMMLVAACPGGNVSNFFSQQAGGNVALSVSLTGIATIAAVFMTPFNFEFYSSLYRPEESIPIVIEFLPMLKTVAIVLIVPLICGILVAKNYPAITAKIARPIRITSFLILLIFMVVAFTKNLEVFTAYYQYILVLVFVHSALALSVGFATGKAFKLKMPDVKTLTIETGIQNSGLGLVLIFALFNGNGGMALLTAWWGIWHIVAGGTISFFFSRV